MATEQVNVLDLFAGCGGFSQGFRQAGFNVVAANEMWQPAINTYITNHPETTVFAGDITLPKVKKEILEFFRGRTCDVIIGGPPCQAYSVAGLRLPTDPRGKLFNDYLQIVKALNPRIFVMENVKGLLYINIEKKGLKPDEAKKIRRITKLKEERAALLVKKVRSKNTDKVKFTKRDAARFAYLVEKIPKLEKNARPFQRKLIDEIMDRIHDLGYEPRYKVLNAANYGVPQLRERVVIIAARDGIPIEFPRETHGTTEGTLPRQVTVKEAIDDLKDVRVDGRINHVFAQHGDEFLRKVKSTEVGGCALGSYKSSFGRLNPDKPSPTVKENHGAVFVHYDRDRVLTARELARLQSFDDSFFFCSATKDVLIQIGNAIPPLLSFAVAKSVRSMLAKADKQSETYKRMNAVSTPEMLNKQ